MIWPASLQARLALSIGLGLTVMWAIAAVFTASVLRHEIDEVFDSTLEETAQRLLPLAVIDIVGRDPDRPGQRMATLREHEEHFTYLVRDVAGRVLMRSHSADDSTFPPYDGMGFRQTPTHRIYSDAALQGTITLSVAEPLAHRIDVAQETLIALVLPLIALVPLSFLGVLLLVRRTLRPVRGFRDRLAVRGAGDLSAITGDDLPKEMMPLAQTLNQLLARLRRAFDSERSFASNAAHELRTPVAAALAQVQRLKSETTDPATAGRAAAIEGALKRLNWVSEKLMQLARAEGSRLRTGTPTDVLPVLRMVADDFIRTQGDPAIALDLPQNPVLSDIDPDAFAILCRNLIENALRHGKADTPIRIRLTVDGILSVTNHCPVLSAEVISHLAERFQRGPSQAEGSGLGLSIVRAIIEGAGGTLALHSPATDLPDGFEAVVTLSRSR